MRRTASPATTDARRFVMAFLSAIRRGNERLRGPHAAAAAIYRIRYLVCQAMIRRNRMDRPPQPLFSPLKELYRYRTVVGFAIVVLAGAASLAGFQGMGRTTRAPRPIPKIETDLPPIAVDYRDVAESAGLTARTISGGDDRKQYILETTGTGVAIFDYDNDDLPDVFVANATSLDGDGEGARATSHLYRNRGQLRFEDVTARAGLARVGWAQGVCAADYDNDGQRDLLVTYFGQTALYRNEGNGTFRDVAMAAGIAAAGSALGHRLLVLRLRSRRSAGSDHHQLSAVRPLAHPGARRHELLPVEGHAGHVRAARPAVLAEPSVSQRGRRTFRRRVTEKRHWYGRRLLWVHRGHDGRRRRWLSRRVRRL